MSPDNIKKLYSRFSISPESPLVKSDLRDYWSHVCIVIDYEDAYDLLCIDTNYSIAAQVFYQAYRHAVLDLVANTFLEDSIASDEFLEFNNQSEIPVYNPVHLLTLPSPGHISSFIEQLSYYQSTYNKYGRLLKARNRASKRRLRKPNKASPSSLIYSTSARNCS